MKNFSQFSKHMKKSCSIGLSLFVLFSSFLISCMSNEKKIEDYKKTNDTVEDTIKYKSIKIQTH